MFNMVKSLSTVCDSEEGSVSSSQTHLPVTSSVGELGNFKQEFFLVSVIFTDLENSLYLFYWVISLFFGNNAISSLSKIKIYEVTQQWYKQSVFLEPPFLYEENLLC